MERRDWMVDREYRRCRFLFWENWVLRDGQSVAFELDLSIAVGEVERCRESRIENSPLFFQILSQIRSGRRRSKANNDMLIAQSHKTQNTCCTTPHRKKCPHENPNPDPRNYRLPSLPFRLRCLNLLRRYRYLSSKH